MTALVKIERNNLGQAISAIDMVFSPDDGGWYFEENDFVKRRSRTSKRIFASADDARRSFSLGTVKWEKWQ